jgi:tRNA threonylcarbamoyladenosine biosynthesis protein TsaE
VEFISQSPSETESLGEIWGRTAAAGWVIGLIGDLGAGKTQLVKGLARGLGITALVHSPTFALLNEYPGGRLPMAHLDLFRLETRRQIVAAGLEEYFFPGPGIAVIEWIDRWLGGTKVLPKDFVGRVVTIELVDENVRRIIYEDVGP